MSKFLARPHLHSSSLCCPAVQILTLTAPDLSSIAEHIKLGHRPKLRHQEADARYIHHAKIKIVGRKRFLGLHSTSLHISTSTVCAHCVFFALLSFKYSRSSSTSTSWTIFSISFCWRVHSALLILVSLRNSSWLGRR